MGLLQRAEAEISASALTHKEKKSFVFPSNPKYSYLCLKLNDEYFVPEYTIGFDYSSIKSCVSSKDFWNGMILEKNKTLIFSKPEKLLPFFQLFSFVIKDSVKSICLYYDTENKNEKIYLIVNKVDDVFLENEMNEFKNSYVLINNFVKTDESFFTSSQSIFEFTLDFSGIFLEELPSVIQKYSSDFYNCVEIEVYNYLRQSFGDYVQKGKDNSYNFLFISENDVSEQLVIEHIYNTIDFITTEKKSRIKIHSHGKCESFFEFKQFFGVF